MKCKCINKKTQTQVWVLPRRHAVLNCPLFSSHWAFPNTAHTVHYKLKLATLFHLLLYLRRYDLHLPVRLSKHSSHRTVWKFCHTSICVGIVCLNMSLILARIFLSNDCFWIRCTVHRNIFWSPTLCHTKSASARRDNLFKTCSFPFPSLIISYLVVYYYSSKNTF